MIRLSDYSDGTLCGDLLREEHRPLFEAIGRAADGLGVDCYVVGGYVRDLFLERPSKDIDVVVVGSGIEVAKALKKSLGRGATLSVFRNFGTAQVKWRHAGEETEVEFVGARRESYSHDSRKPIVEDGTLEDDISRRDFTVNALAICLNHTPDADGQARYGRLERIKIISGERIIDELNKIILSPVPSIGFVLLEQCGLLELIFPELAAMRGIETRNGRAHKDNFYHTLEVLDNISRTTSSLFLRWAALLHDIGKPRSKRWDPSAGWTFHNHNLIGQRMVQGIFRRLKLPMDERMHFVEKLVGLHMRPIAIADDEVTDHAVRKLLFEAGEDIDDLMLLCEADVTSKNREKKARFLENFQLVREKIADLAARDDYRTWQNPISGEEIMATFGLPPSRPVGDLKQAVKDAIWDSKIPNTHEAAFRFMLEKAAEMGLRPVAPSKT